MTDDGFLKGQSGNLPLVDMFMVASYIKTTASFSLSEFHAAKANRSEKHSYGDSAVGGVQLRRAKNVCRVKAKVTPQHNVSKKQYDVTCSIDEECNKVLDLQCHDCAASSDGCKHAIAFLMWLHRRSEESSPSEAVCYWTKSKLSQVETSNKYLTLKDFGAPEELSSNEESALFLQEVVTLGLENNSESQLLKHFKPDKIKE